MFGFSNKARKYTANSFMGRLLRSLESVTVSTTSWYTEETVHDASTFFLVYPTSRLMGLRFQGYLNSTRGHLTNPMTVFVPVVVPMAN